MLNSVLQDILRIRKRWEIGCFEAERSAFLDGGDRGIGEELHHRFHAVELLYQRHTLLLVIDQRVCIGVEREGHQTASQDHR